MKAPKIAIGESVSIIAADSQYKGKTAIVLGKIGKTWRISFLSNGEQIFLELPSKDLQALGF